MVEGEEESSPGSDLIRAEREAHENAVHTYFDIFGPIVKPQTRKLFGRCS